MDITGEYHIQAPRTRVWEALNDPAILATSIPGCEALEKISDTEFTARICSRIGAIKARFNGSVSLSEIDPPNGYLISGQGQGGVAGVAKGSARVTLEALGEETILRYSARAEVAGKLATVGSRVIEGVAKKTAEDFFQAFSARVVGEPISAIGEATATGSSSKLGKWLLAAGIAAAALAALALLLSK